MKLLNLAPYALGTYLVRLLITGASLGDSFTLIGLSGLYAYFLFLESKKQVPVNKEIWDRLIALEEKSKTHQDNFNALQIKNTFLNKRN